jgi:hypothetical protein
MSRLRNAIKTLHARKDRAYGAAWKRRGERISILPNIARKVDRLTAFVASGFELRDESLLDTAIDLNVYCLKYLLFLVDSDPSLLGKLSLRRPEWPLSDREENFDQLIEAANYEEAASKSSTELISRVSELFEKLWPAVEAGASTEKRFAMADELAKSSTQLLSRVCAEEAGAVELFIKNELGLVSKEAPR